MTIRAHCNFTKAVTSGAGEALLLERRSKERNLKQTWQNININSGDGYVLNAKLLQLCPTL